MNIETLPLSDLHTDPANVRKHDQRNLDAIKASLSAFGQQKPIVISKDNIVLAGNGTLSAARALGWQTLRAVRTELTGAVAVAYAIADNRTAELAHWDESALAQTLAALQNDENFDHQCAGFSDDEIEDIVDQAVGMEEDNAPDEQQIPETWQLLVTCADEMDQKLLYEQLTEQGYSCRVMTL